jgi:3-hydroxybutyryl-CoA dehydrogenase
MAARLIESVGVLGAGTMGAGIAQVVSLAGIRVRIHDVDRAALDRGWEKATSSIDEGVRRGKVTGEQRDRALSCLSRAETFGEAVSGSDLVIEAVPEILELKREIFGKLGSACAPSTILATNTSSLPVATIAAGVPEPSRILGLHFFNPPHIMKLVEIVRAEATGETVLEAGRSFVSRIGKEAIVVRDSPGFATSRLGLALGLEAMRMLEQEVASAADIDRAMELGYGHPMGPLKVSDLVGLDVRLKIAEILHRELGDDRFRPPEILKRLVAEGKLGKKSGEGFHRHDGGGNRN